MLIDRLWAKSKKTESGCWEWYGANNGVGYGVINVKIGGAKPLMLVHRVAYELLVEAIPVGKILLHTCDNPKCWNPDHLVVGTKSDNSQDMMFKNRGKHQITGIEKLHRKLSDGDIAFIKNAPKYRGSEVALAAKFGVCRRAIWCVS